VQVLEQAFAAVVHPPSENTPRPRHESPAPHSESDPQTAPADFRGELLQARRIVDADANVNTRPVRIASDRREPASFAQSGASAP
jgi:hypothetical protein